MTVDNLDELEEALNHLAVDGSQAQSVVIVADPASDTSSAQTPDTEANTSW